MAKEKPRTNEGKLLSLVEQLSVRVECIEGILKGPLPAQAIIPSKPKIAKLAMMNISRDVTSKMFYRAMKMAKDLKCTHFVFFHEYLCSTFQPLTETTYITYPQTGRGRDTKGCLLEVASWVPNDTEVVMFTAGLNNQDVAPVALADRLMIVNFV